MGYFEKDGPLLRAVKPTAEEKMVVTLKSMPACSAK